MTKLAIIGVGKMGAAVLGGLIAGGWPAPDIAAVEPDATSASRVTAQFAVPVLPPAEAVTGAAAVVLVVKPADVPKALDGIAEWFPADAVLVSLAAGVPISTLEAHLPPGTAVVRVMPNTPALVGKGMAAVSPGTACPPAALDLATRILGAVGQVVRVPEALQSAVTAVSGSGPAYVFAVAEAMIDAGVRLGLSRPLATQLSVQTLLGAATMLCETGEHPTVLRENVTSPGGTTAAALHELERASLKFAFAEAMQACARRSDELTERFATAAG